MLILDRFNLQTAITYGALIALLATTYTSLTYALPNIRIQVNNENLQNPPYLLEAIKQVEAQESSGALNQTPHVNPPDLKSTSNQTSYNDLRVPSGGNGSRSDVHKPNEDETVAEESETPGFSVVKEETIEEILELDPESVLKLSPERLISGLSPSDYSKISDNVASETSNHGTTDSENNKRDEEIVVKKTENLNGRKPQLPVSSSHLKKPPTQMNDEAISDTATSSTEPKSGGAKSLVAPIVTLDDVPSDELKRKAHPTPPDTWDASQIMNGPSNTSLVPATINREYGSATRTRITLGGGYVRDRQPPLVNPASHNYNDDKPEKPVTPLERPKLNPPTGPVEVSRVIEVPEKIVLPATVSKFNENPNNKASGNTTQQVGKLDSRCPKKGVMTFEHSSACDSYYLCEDGYSYEQTCPNGLMYGTRDMVVDYCVHRWRVNCEEKSVPNPISSPGCRWQYGVFNVQGSPKCSPDFYECTAGRFEVKRCSIDGQVFDDRTKSCEFAEKVGCVNEALASFQCPPDDQGNTYWPFPRYFLNERALIHCVNDKPEIVRCTNDERVDPEHLHCVPLSKLGQPAGSELGERRVREKKKKKTD